MPPSEAPIDSWLDQLLNTYGETDPRSMPYVSADIQALALVKIAYHIEEIVERNRREDKAKTRGER